jgi:ankyrin repeat protein
VQKIFENHPFDPLRANINAVNRQDGEKPLLYAAIHSGRTDVVEYILERMSENDVRSCRDDQGNSALHIAAVAESPHPDGSRYIMQKLVEKGADKTATNKAGQSILQFAVSFHNGPADVEGVEYLLENGSLEQEDDWTCIVYELVALDYDDWSGTNILPIIEMIMGRKFVDFYRENRDGMSLAHYMAKQHERCNLTDIFDSFKKRQINFTRRDKSGKTLLELAYPSVLPNAIFEIDRGQCYDNIRSLCFLLKDRVYGDHESHRPKWTLQDSDARPSNFKMALQRFVQPRIPLGTSFAVTTYVRMK